MVQPLTINALTYVKSDWTGGLLLVGALFLLNASVEKARPDLKLFGAGLLGLSILSKLTAFYLPVLALGILLLFEWHHALIAICRSLIRRSVRKRFSDQVSLWFQTIAVHSYFARQLRYVPFCYFLFTSLDPSISYIRSAIGRQYLARRIYDVRKSSLL